MPRAVKVSTKPPQVAVYQVSNGEELTVLAVSCVFRATANNPPYGYPFFDWRDAAGGLIYRQTLNNILNDDVGVSASADGEPWYVSNNGPFGFPQANEQQSYATMSLRIPRITLTPGCTFSIYITSKVFANNEVPGSFFLSGKHIIDSAHLWVDDNAGSSYIAPEPLPPILVHAPELV